MPRFSDLYTLTIASADPKSISANEPVNSTKSVTQWYVYLSLKFTLANALQALRKDMDLLYKLVEYKIILYNFVSATGSLRMEFW